MIFLPSLFSLSKEEFLLPPFNSIYFKPVKPSVPKVAKLSSFIGVLCFTIISTCISSEFFGLIFIFCTLPTSTPLNFTGESIFSPETDSFIYIV